MALKAPGFWSNDRTKPGVLARLLTPASAVWIIATRRRLQNGPWHRVAVPVICVGNLTAGGAGKTPVVMHVLEKLSGLGANPHALTRGFGGSETGPTHVDPTTHTAAEVGDEALLLSAFAPTWIARDRHKGALAAIEAGADLIVMDDGHQNPSLQKDLSLLVVDAETGFGNGWVMPAGPLREPLHEGLARADHMVLIGDPEHQASFLERWPEATGLASTNATLKPLATGMPWKGLRVLAFAGIARPQKFYDTLSALGADLVATHDFGDHEPFSASVIARLEKEAKSLSAQLVTTEKDAVRLPAATRSGILTLPVRLETDPPEAIDSLLHALLDR